MPVEGEMSGIVYVVGAVVLLAGWVVGILAFVGALSNTHEIGELKRELAALRKPTPDDLARR